MAETVPMDAAGLRAAVADDLYWQAGHPEHEAWRAWVSEGFRAVHGEGDGPAGVVHVRAYSRTRDGRTEHVRAHLRSDPPGGDAADPAGLHPGTVQYAAAPLVAVAPVVIGAGGRVAGQIIHRLPSLSRSNLLDRILGRGGSTGWSILNNEADDEADPPDLDPAVGHQSGAVAQDGERPRYTVHDDQQGKHVPGHNNHDPNRSTLAEGVDPQALADEFAGRGQAVAGVPGQAGYRERIDAGERIIGTWRDQSNRNALPTTRAIIHHGTGGRIHIVPSRPRG